jgi:site-specific recombinase XerD
MADPHPDFATLAESWDLALGADGYAANTVISYTKAVRSFAEWVGPDISPEGATRDHVRGWVRSVREATSSGTARSLLPGLRHFYRWMVAEGEMGADPTEGVRTPAPNDTVTTTLKVAQIRALLATCVGREGDRFVDRRDAAIILLFVDGGLRLAELAGLPTDAVSIRDRMVFVEGKGSNRSGPRRRAVPLGVKATQAIDRYVRERRRHPYADQPQLWLGARGRPHLSPDGVDAMLKRRAAVAGLEAIHPHMFRHSWASEFRRAGGSEGDLMVLGGWHTRSMLDRYGREEAGERAREAYRKRSLGDRL